MDVVKKQYECVSGYAVAPEGTYEIGDEIDGIGAVQYIVNPDKPAGEKFNQKVELNLTK